MLCGAVPGEVGPFFGAKIAPLDVAVVVLETRSIHSLEMASLVVMTDRKIATVMSS